MAKSPKPTILVFIDYYLPGFKAGGPTRTLANLVEWLGDVFDFKILTKDRDLGDQEPYSEVKPNVWHRVGKAQIMYLQPNELSLRELRRHLWQTSYDVIYLNTAFSNLTVFTLMLARVSLIPNKPIIVAARGNLSKNALSIKPWKKRAFLKVAKYLSLYEKVTWHATSAEEREDIERIFDIGAKSQIVQITNLPIKPQTQKIPRVHPKTIGIIRIIFLSRISRMKNVDYILKVLNNLHGHVIFDLWGPIEDTSYWQHCQSLVQLLPDTVRVNYRGIVPPNRVVETLAGYDLFFLPSLSENYGHVILEALCAGCPVLISDQTPWTNVTTHGAGWAIPLSEPQQFQSVIQQVVDMNEMELSAISQRALAYSADYMNNTSTAILMQQFLLETVKIG